MGYYVSGTSVATATSSTPNTIQSISIPVGSWILFGNATYQSGLTYAVLSISSTNNTRESSCEVQIISITSGQPVINITRGVSLSSSITLYLVAQSSSAANVANIAFYAIRVG